MYWARNLTATENYQWKEQGLPAVAPMPYKPFPASRIDLEKLPFPHEFTSEDLPDYIDIVMGFMLFAKDLCPENELWIPKTRQMLTSWAAVHFIVWMCQFFEKIEWIAQSEDDLKAQGLIKYANILYSNQPEWLKQMHPLARGSEEGTQHKIEWATGSLFRALPSGVRKFASSHAYGYLSDETAHQAGAEATINIVKPAVKQIICVSSVAPSWFWNECEAA